MKTVCVREGLKSLTFKGKRYEFGSEYAMDDKSADALLSLKDDTDVPYFYEQKVHAVDATVGAKQEAPKPVPPTVAAPQVKAAKAPGVVTV